MGVFIMGHSRSSAIALSLPVGQDEVLPFLQKMGINPEIRNQIARLYEISRCGSDRFWA